MIIMNKEDKLNLKNMVSKYNPVETTDKIRDLKHSKQIRGCYYIFKLKNIND